jgi:CelD/BcsL family acetyltransferase involved in cellulose biosynthesis
MVTLALGDGRSTIPPVRRRAEFWVEICDSAETAEVHQAAWDDLAWHALEPNPFYESWMLLPAWRAFGATPPVRLACVFRNGARPQDPPELCGLVPLVRERYGRWPVDVWRSWQHQYCFLCTPLLRQGVAVEALRALWNWMNDAIRGPSLWELPHVTVGGLFHQALIEVANERGAALPVVQQFNRALLVPAETAETYCNATMTCHNRQDVRRKWRRLNEQGRVEMRVSNPGEPIEPWIDQFLAVEASGWKGLEHTALAAAEADAAFFRNIVATAAERNQVVFLGLFLDDKPIALKVNLLAGEGGFAFKIAFDETFARFSPGVQLELENIEWVHKQRGLRWMDSCAKPGHFMIGRLWRERRTIQQVVVSTGSWRGDLMIGLIPLVRAVKSLFKPPAVTTSGVTAT